MWIERPHSLSLSLSLSIYIYIYYILPVSLSLSLYIYIYISSQFLSLSLYIYILSSQFLSLSLSLSLSLFFLLSYGFFLSVIIDWEQCTFDMREAYLLERNAKKRCLLGFALLSLQIIVAMYHGPHLDFLPWLDLRPCRSDEHCLIPRQHWDALWRLAPLLHLKFSWHDEQN